MKKKDDLHEYSSELIEIGKERRSWNQFKSYSKAKIKQHWYVFVILCGLLVWVVDNKAINFVNMLKVFFKGMGL